MTNLSVAQVHTCFSDDEFVKEISYQVTDNEVNNESPNIWVTDDAVINILWATHGPVFVLSGLGIERDSPLVMLRNEEGVFDEDFIQDCRTTEDFLISGTEFPTAVRYTPTNDVLLCFLRGDVPQIVFKKEPEPVWTVVEPLSAPRKDLWFTRGFRKDDNYYIFHPPVRLCSVVPQKVSLVKHDDNTVVLSFVEPCPKGNVIKFYRTADVGVTWIGSGTDVLPKQEYVVECVPDEEPVTKQQIVTDDKFSLRYDYDVVVLGGKVEKALFQGENIYKYVETINGTFLPNQYLGSLYDNTRTGALFVSHSSGIDFVVSISCDNGVTWQQQPCEELI